MKESKKPQRNEENLISAHIVIGKLQEYEGLESRTNSHSNKVIQLVNKNSELGST